MLGYTKTFVSKSLRAHHCAATTFATAIRMQTSSATAAAATTTTAATATAAIPAPAPASNSTNSAATTKDDDSSPVVAKVSIKDLFRIRSYRPKEDDKAFQELDRQCSQGEKTKLVSEFPLTLSFEEVQPKGVSIVLEDKANGAMAGTTRSYIRDVVVNGVSRRLSYHFLLRVNPAYRNQGLGGYMMGLLYKKDLVAGDVDHVSAYVIENNNTSAKIQQKVQQQNEKRTASSGEGAVLDGFENLGVYSSIAWHVNAEKPIALPALSSPTTITHITDKAQQAAKISSALSSNQLFPVDLDVLVGHELNLGTFVTRDEQGREAGALVWHSGRFRKTYIQGSNFHYDRSVLIHNTWTSDQSQESVQLLDHLIKSISNKFAADKTATSVLSFTPRDHAVTKGLSSLSPYHVEWLLKFWQIKGEKRQTDMAGGRVAFYDPRQCLL